MGQGEGGKVGEKTLPNKDHFHSWVYSPCNPQSNSKTPTKRKKQLVPQGGKGPVPLKEKGRKHWKEKVPKEEVGSQKNLYPVGAMEKTPS